MTKSNRFIWFEKWVVERQTIAQLSRESGYSVRSLKTYFHDYLLQAPTFKIYPSERVNLLMDGTYFNNNLCLVLYRDNSIKFTQLYRLTDGEWYEEIKEDLENLLELGVEIESITCDGHRAQLKAIRKVCKHVALQRCVVHIQRMCMIWLRMNPKTNAGMELRRIASRLHTIDSELKRQQWMMSVINWHREHESFINEKTTNVNTGRQWFKHKNVRRSFVVIKKALPNMFHYLENPRIPKSTNGLESFFGHLKGHLNVHRGLSYEHRKNFIKWYLHFKNKGVFFSHRQQRLK